MPDPTARTTIEGTEDGRFVVTCPACDWTHHTTHQRLAERLAAGHRCARYVEARR